ncbi:MAG: geranylgeranyl reductase family protein [Euryarchaeota archaeon]|nr:geranylgeranyl reductase family protein [Euryarchaeota archaeon]
MAKEYDAIVAGGGPGGATTATFLARQGYKVALFEKERFPRDKPCGDAISGKSVRVLDALGLIDQVEKVPMALALGVRFTSPDTTELVVPFPKPKASEERVAMGKSHNEPGYVCRREIYDNVLFQAAKKTKGVKVFEETPVESAIMEGGRCVGVKTKDGKEHRAKVVVGAGGALCPVGRTVGAYERDPAHWVAAIRVYWKDVKDVDDNIEIHFVDDIIPGYFWIFPLENGLANVGIGMREDYVKKDKKDLKELLDRCIHDNPLFVERFAGATKVEGSQRGWILPLGSRRRRLSGEGWLTVGDAAGLIDPFSGEGIGNAMVSGQLAAEQIHIALSNGGATADALAPYDIKVWAEIGDELERSYKMQKLGRHKWLLNFVVRKAAKSPRLQAQLSEMLSDREDTDELTNWWFYLRLLFMK